MMRLLLFFILIGYGSLVPAHSWPWCVDLPPSANTKQLSCLKSLNVSPLLRNTFNKIAKMKEKCPRCSSSIAGDEDLQSLFKSPFLVIAMTLSTGAYSAYDMHIVFRERPTQEFQIGIDYAEKEAYEPRVVVAMNPSKKIEKLIKKLSQKEYAEYWLK